MFQRILVANRGEIALRVIRACHDLGIEAVAVFSEADRGAPYLQLADEAICIGPPASAGGGGRGMRVARNDINLRSGLKAAQQEAEKAFKDGSVYLEKYIEQPRHIEVQILGDRQGNVVHLWERDCSLQRRHQKLVEESPAPNLPAEVRAQICAAAVQLVKAANYSNAGTCEFLLDSDFNFYFIEVNARIQVEHPVTELVTGIDLVREQIRIAAGESLRFAQS